MDIGEPVRTVEMPEQEPAVEPQEPAPEREPEREPERVPEREVNNIVSRGATEIGNAAASRSAQL